VNEAISLKTKTAEEMDIVSRAILHVLKPYIVNSVRFMAISTNSPFRIATRLKELFPKQFDLKVLRTKTRLPRRL
jgi:hypothetical protein